MEDKRGFGDSYEFETKNFVTSLIEVAKTVSTKPDDFYQHMPTTGGFGPPVIFLAVCMLISSLLMAIIKGSFSLFFNVIIMFLVGTFIGAVILYLLARKLFEGKGGFEGTLRVVAYAGVTGLLTWIPIVQILVAMYGLYLIIVGLAKVHAISKGQAAIVVLIPVGVVILMALMIASLLFFLY